MGFMVLLMAVLCLGFEGKRSSLFVEALVRGLKVNCVGIDRGRCLSFEAPRVLGGALPAGWSMMIFCLCVFGFAAFGFVGVCWVSAVYPVFRTGGAGGECVPWEVVIVPVAPVAVVVLGLQVWTLPTRCVVGIFGRVLCWLRAAYSVVCRDVWPGLFLGARGRLVPDPALPVIDIVLPVYLVVIGCCVSVLLCLSLLVHWCLCYPFECGVGFDRGWF
jgi:hypothetical protein